MTLTENITKYWTLRTIGKQESSRKQSTQSIILMKYSSNYQIFGNQYYEKAKEENNRQNYNIIKLSPQRSVNKYGSCTGPQPKSTSQVLIVEDHMLLTVKGVQPINNWCSVNMWWTIKTLCLHFEAKFGPSSTAQG